MSIQVDVILVTGPTHSGKTRFLQSLCPEALITPGEKAVSLVTLPVAADALLIFLEIPGTVRVNLAKLFHPSARVLGVLMLLDSRSPDTFPAAKREMLDFQQDFPDVPRLAVATRQDALDAWTIDELHTALKMSQGDIVPCGALQHESVKAVVIALLNRVPSDASVEKAIATINAL